MINPYNKLLQHSLLSKEETYSLIKQYQETSEPKVKQHIEATLLRHNFKYVYKLAFNFYKSHSNIELDDCVQSASLAVGKAASKFDLTRNLSFSTYLTWWVRSYLQRYWQKHSRVVKVPVHIQDTYIRIKKFIRQYSLKNDGTTPSYTEIAEYLDIKPSKVRDAISFLRPTASLNTIIKGREDEDSQLLDFIPDDKVDSPTDVLDGESLTQSLNSILSTLSSKERRVIELRYGLTGNPPMSLQAIGDKFGFTRENTRLITNKVLAQLRGNFKTWFLWLQIITVGKT